MLSGSPGQCCCCLGGGYVCSPRLQQLLDAVVVTSDSGRIRRNYPGMIIAQALALPAVLAGGDVILAAETGSGKTLAYLLPLMQRLLARGQAAEAAGRDERWVVLSR